MANLGLIFIIAAWLFQLFFVLRKSNNIQPLFILIYIFGVLLLVIDGYKTHLFLLATLNLLSLAAATAVLLKLNRGQES